PSQFLSHPRLTRGSCDRLREAERAVGAQPGASGPGPLYALHGICLIGYIPGVATSFQVLADPTRRRILDLLLERPWPVGELAERLRITQPGTSKHLRVLREAGLVAARQDAQRRWYELRPGPLAEIDAWLQPYRRLWEASLDDLERHLDVMPDETDEAEGTAS